MTSDERIQRFPLLGELGDENPVALTADGFDEALVGLARRPGQPTLAVYDFNKAVDLLQSRDGMTASEAEEYLEFNTVGAWMGPNTPLWLYTEG